MRAAIRVTLRQWVHPHGPAVHALADRYALINIRSRQPPAQWTRTRPPWAGHLPAAVRTVLRTACDAGIDAEIGRLLGARTILALVDAAAARAKPTRVSTCVVQPHATGPSALRRIRTDGHPELVALRLLTAISAKGHTTGQRQ